LARPDVEDGVGARWMRTERTARQRSQREHRNETAARKDFRILLNHIALHSDDEQLLDRGCSILARLLVRQVTIAPGQFLGRKRKLTLDLKRQQPLKFLFRSRGN